MAEIVRKQCGADG